MADYVLDKGFPVLATYNSSAVAGVTNYRVVKLASTGIDIQTTASAAAGYVGVVQENIDAVKVATGKTIADVRVAGVSWVFVAASGTAPTIGSRCMAGAGGGVVVAATTGSSVLGIVIGATTITQTIANGDLIEVLLTPGVLF